MYGSLCSWYDGLSDGPGLHVPPPLWGTLAALDGLQARAYAGRRGLTGIALIAARFALIAASQGNAVVLVWGSTGFGSLT